MHNSSVSTHRSLRCQQPLYWSPLSLGGKKKDLESRPLLLLRRGRVSGAALALALAVGVGVGGSSAALALVLGRTHCPRLQGQVSVAWRSRARRPKTGRGRVTAVPDWRRRPRSGPCPCPWTDALPPPAGPSVRRLASTRAPKTGEGGVTAVPDRRRRRRSGPCPCPWTDALPLPAGPGVSRLESTRAPRMGEEGAGEVPDQRLRREGPSYERGSIFSRHCACQFQPSS